MKPDVIIVGAGVAGSAAAIKLANNGLNVVLIDRGLPIGSKNLSGGVLWGNDLAEIIPDWQDEAPIERYLINKKIGFLAQTDATIIDIQLDEWNKKPYSGVTVLRAHFDEWLAQKAEEAGVAVFSGINIDELIVENGVIKGVKQENEELRAPVVIIAEGANARLVLKHEMSYKGDKKRYGTHDFMIGLKEVIQLKPDIINERFLLDDKQGIAGEFIVGNLPDSELKVGGFFYTNKTSISIGVVVHLDSLRTENRSYEVLEHFKNHPYIKRLIKDGTSIEYGAKIIPEMGIKKFPKLSGNGFLVIGDAAGFVFSNGLVIQGMNYAIKSGLLAADAIIKAKQRQDFSSSSLSEYDKLLEKSYILKDFKRMKNVKKMTKNPRLFKIYPQAINNGFRNYMTEDGKPKDHFVKLFLKSFKEAGAGIFTLVKDGLKVRNL